MIQDSLFSRYGEHHLTPDYPVNTDPIYNEVKGLSDLERARRWMKSWPDRWFTPEQLQREANLSIGTPALSRKMRLYRKQGQLESKLRYGKQYKEYKWLTPKSNLI